MVVFSDFKRTFETTNRCVILNKTKDVLIVLMVIYETFYRSYIVSNFCGQAKRFLLNDMGSCMSIYWVLFFYTVTMISDDTYDDLNIMKNPSGND